MATQRVTLSTKHEELRLSKINRKSNPCLLLTRIRTVAHSDYQPQLLLRLIERRVRPLDFVLGYLTVTFHNDFVHKALRSVVKNVKSHESEI